MQINKFGLDLRSETELTVLTAWAFSVLEDNYAADVFSIMCAGNVAAVDHRMRLYL